ncbi:hypothetical protein [Natronorubrum halophilum]|uniref:hypothetical protein n=1 Tax=Natronorubrum halophilum TaxID=1702106 RepID=UPI000EF65A12|nr:hypothetical protein [Natronorubrum halophilum]
MPQKDSLTAVFRDADEVVDENREMAHRMMDNRGIMPEVRMIGGAMVTILIIALVLTEIYNAVSINNTSAFYSLVEDLETTGVAAMSLLVVGLLVVAASAIMRYFGGGFGGGR